MKATKYESYTKIFLTKEEEQELCKPITPDRCIWHISGECLYHNRPAILVNKFRDGDTIGKRDGCDKVKSFDPAGKPIGELDI